MVLLRSLCRFDENMYERFYIDLFAGAERGVRGEIQWSLVGSSLLALKIRVPFEEHIRDETVSPSRLSGIGCAKNLRHRWRDSAG